MAKTTCTLLSQPEIVCSARSFRATSLQLLASEAEARSRRWGRTLHWGRSLFMVQPLQLEMDWCIFKICKFLHDDYKIHIKGIHFNYIFTVFWIHFIHILTGFWRYFYSFYQYISAKIGYILNSLHYVWQKCIGLTLAKRSAFGTFHGVCRVVCVKVVCNCPLFRAVVLL